MHMPAKKAVNLSLDAELLDEARAEHIKLSAIAERAVRAEIASIRAERWKRENAAALEAMAERIAEEGVAGEEYRSFG
jgi:antitoxin CcdA